MKRNIKTNLAALEKEFLHNESAIKKLQKRNEAITAVFNSVEKLTGTGVGLPKTNPLMGKLKTEGRPAKILSLIDTTGEKMHVREIAFRFFGHDPSQQEVDIVNNVCANLTKAKKILRPERGYYQTARPQKTTTTIGADTRVTQVAATAAKEAASEN